MDFEENKDNIIEESPIPEEQPETKESAAEEPVTEEVPAEETVLETTVSEEPDTEETAGKDPDAQETEEEEAVTEEPAAEEAAAEEITSEETASEETASEETVQEAEPEEQASEETVPEEALAEAPVSETPEPDAATAGETTAEEAVPETIVPEEVALEETSGETTQEEEEEEPPLVTEIVPEEPEETAEPESDSENDVPEFEFERVIPEVVVLEVTEDILADTVEEKEEPKPEEPEPEELEPEELELEELELEEPELEPEQELEEIIEEELAEEESAEEEFREAEAEAVFEEVLTETEEPFEEPEKTEEAVEKTPAKKGSGALAVKIIGIILLLLLIFVPAGYSLYKGEAFRKDLINRKKSLSRTYESVYRNEIFPKLSKMFIPEWAKKVEPEPEPQGSGQVEPVPQTPDTDKAKDILDGVPQVPEGLDYYPMYVEDHMIIYGRDNWLYTAGDGGAALEYYAGTNVLSEEEMAYCAELLNTLYEICQAKGVEFVMEVGPNKEQVYPEHFPSYTIETPYKRLLVLEEYLHENCNAPFVYPIRELAAHKDQYDTYWKYDTHWNSTGSFVGMKAIYEALGRPIDDKDAVMRTEETNRGDLAGITAYTDLYTDYITDYKPGVSVESEVYCDWEYDIDDYGKRYTTSAPNERKLFVCGDSFRVSLAAHMCKDYKYTDVVHRDIVGLEIPVERLRALTEGDTLVLVCVERWDYYMFDVIPVIIEAMQG